MAMQIKLLTKTQLVQYFNVYRDKFPDWEVRHDVVLVRSVGPIEQHIAFQALRAGSYRPSCSVVVKGPPDGAQLLFRLLDIKHEQVFPREHDSKWSQVLKAMEEQFLPPIRKPLDVADVLQLAEGEAVRDKIENINHSCGLATLNAYVGNVDRAVWWCDRLESQLANLGRDPADWELRKSDFARQLRDAVRRGEATDFLQAPRD